MGKVIDTDLLVKDLMYSFHIDSEDEFKERYPYRVLSKVIDRQPDLYTKVVRHGYIYHTHSEMRQHGTFGKLIVLERLRCSHCNAEFRPGDILNYCPVCGTKLDLPDRFEKDEEELQKDVRYGRSSGEEAPRESR